jgi:PDZ domain
VDHPLPRADSAGHDQTMELAKTFLQRCPDLIPTMNKDRADFDVHLNWTPKTRLFLGGKIVHKPDQILVTTPDGDIIYSGIARTVGGVVDDACKAIHDAYRSALSKQQQQQLGTPASNRNSPHTETQQTVVSSRLTSLPASTVGTERSVPVEPATSIKIGAAASREQEASIGASAQGNPTVRHDGVTLSEIESGGPCDQSGLQIGDVLLALDGHYFFTANEVAEEIDRHRPGEKIAIRFRRTAMIYDTYLTLASRRSPTPDAQIAGNVKQF